MRPVLAISALAVTLTAGVAPRLGVRAAGRHGAGQLDALTHIPGTASAWAAGGLFPGDGSSQGVVLKDGS